MCSGAALALLTLSGCAPETPAKPRVKVSLPDPRQVVLDPPSKPVAKRGDDLGAHGLRLEAALEEATRRLESSRENYRTNVFEPFGSSGTD